MESVEIISYKTEINIITRSSGDGLEMKMKMKCLEPLFKNILLQILMKNQ